MNTTPRSATIRLALWASCALLWACAPDAREPVGDAREPVGDAREPVGDALAPLVLDLGGAQVLDGVGDGVGLTDSGFGASVARVGDFNGDGYNDAAVGSPQLDTARGRVTLYFGGPAGISDQNITVHSEGDDNTSFGWTVAAAGDVNCDGLADLAVGAPYYDISGSGNQGQVLVYLGNSAGRFENPRTVTGTIGNGLFGWSIVGAGDLNGDGCGDLLVGAPGEGSGAGVLWVLRGSSGALTRDASPASQGPALARLGTSLAALGDVNGDDAPDFAVGLPGTFGVTNIAGQARLLLSFAGEPLGATPINLDGQRLGEYFGASIVGVGDVNNDNFGDFVVGAPHSAMAGRAYLYLGASSFPASPAPHSSFTDNTPGGTFAYSLANVGDLNGDGRPDLAIGSPTYPGTNATAAARVGKVEVWLSPLTSTLPPSLTLLGNQPSTNLGASLAGIGDINADGYGDLLMGAPCDLSNGATSCNAPGEARLRLGSPSFPQGARVSWRGASHQGLGATVTGLGDSDGDGLGDILLGTLAQDEGGRQTSSSLHLYRGGSYTNLWIYTPTAPTILLPDAQPLGDVNGDGYADFAVATQTDREYSVLVFRGSSQGPPQTPNQSFSVGASPSLAGVGDLDGDGFADLVVAVPSFGGGLAVYRGSPLGLQAEEVLASDVIDQVISKVARAGDFDGDGYDDFLTRYDNELALYFGAQRGQPLVKVTLVGGLDALTPLSFVGVGDVNGDGYGDVVVSNTSDNFPEVRLYLGSYTRTDPNSVVLRGGPGSGKSLAALGDANGDGYADFAVGDNNSAYVFWGTPTPPTQLQALNITSKTLPPKVAAAGDTDGDGLADLLFADLSAEDAQGGLDAGRVWLYPGARADFKALTSLTGTLNADLSDATVALGDLNNDGFDELVVGTPGVAIGGNNAAGRVRVYQGGQGGFARSANATFEGTLANQRLGASVSVGGDVNGDGYRDLLVGARGCGGTLFSCVRVYFGAATLTTLTHAQTLTRPATITSADLFGFSLSADGDVDNDGYADALIGAPDARIGASTRKDGRAYLYRGGPNGLYASPAWSIEGLNNGNLDERVGFAVAHAGDLDGDGYGDVVVGAPDVGTNISKEGVLRVFHGSPQGLPDAPSAELGGGTSKRRLGRALLAVGDLNGDGFDDLVAGTKGAGDEDGLRVYLGSPDGLGGARGGFLAERFFLGSSGEFDASLAALGDEDQDGRAAYAVGLPALRTSAGEVWVVQGTSLASSQTLQGGGAFGTFLASGDFNADDAVDLFVGAPSAVVGTPVGVNQGSNLTMLWGNSGDLPTGQNPTRLRYARILGESNSPPVAQGGRLPDPDRLHVGLVVSRAWGQGRAKAELEVKPVDVPFDGLGLVSSTSWTGANPDALALGLSPDQAYRWRARLRMDPAHALPHDRSPWVYGGFFQLPARAHNSTALERSLVVFPEAISLDEGEPGARVELRLSANNPRDVIVTLRSVIGEVGPVLTPDTLLFEAGEGTTPQTVSLALPEDDVANISPRNFLLELNTSSDDDPWSNLSTTLNATLRDNDTPGVRISELAPSVTEGGSLTLEVSLTSRPLAEVVLVAPNLAGVTASWSNTGRSRVVVAPEDWNTPQLLLLSTSQDTLAQGNRSATGRVSTESQDATYSGLSSEALNFVTLDDEVASVVVDPDSVGLVEGTSATFALRLAAQPIGVVQVSLSAPAGLTFSPNALSFTDDDWGTPQNVTVSSNDDDLDQGSRTLEAALTSSWPVVGVVREAMVLHVTEDDQAGVEVAQSGGSTFAVEGDASGDSFTVRLTSQPTANVTANLTVGTPLQLALQDGSGGLLLSLVFGVDDWDIPQTVRVVALEDNLPEEVHQASVLYTFSSSDPKYHSLFGGTLLVTIQDSDEPVNRPPTLSVTAPPSATEGDTITLVAQAADPEGEPVTLLWDLDGDGTPETEGARVEWVAPNGPETARVLVRASDGVQQAEDFAVVVVANAPPDILEDLPTTAYVGALYAHEVLGQDPGALDALTWSFAQLPPGMVMGECAQPSPRCRLLSWTPDQPGEVTLRFSVSDGISSSQVRKTITVRSDDAQDTDGGGAPDACELSHAFNPNDAQDDAQDSDGDGLSLALECTLGRNPRISGLPPAPMKIGPEDGATVPRIALVVAPVVDPDGDTSLEYTFEVGLRGGALAPFPGFALAGTYISEPEAEWTEDAWYTWRARASDPYGSGPWSEPCDLFYSSRNDPPPAPALLSPVGGLTLPTPTLVAAQVEDPEGGAVSYVFELYSGEEPTPLTTTSADPGDEGTVAWSPDQALAEGLYRWRVRAEDELGLAGPWSPEATFEVRVELDPPGIPGLLWPPQGAVVPGAEGLVLLVTQADDPAQAPLRYRFEATVGEQAASLDELAPLDGQVAVGWADFGLDLPPGAQVSWSVQAYDPASGREGAVLLANFSAAPPNQPPSAPVLQAPVDNAQTTTRRPLLSWLNPADPDGDPLVFAVSLWPAGRDEPEAPTLDGLLVAPGLTTSAALLAPEGAVELRWRVWASDGQHDPVPSEIGAFFVPSPDPLPAPGAPVILSPGVEQGERLAAADPLALRFRRAAAPQNGTWTHQLALLRASDELVVLERTIQEDKDVLEAQTDPLDPGLYLWRVRSCDETLCGPWATSELFSLDAPANPNGDEDPDGEDPVVDVGVSPESGCACGLAGGARSPYGGFALLLWGLITLARRRRGA